ncbi:hypothetical protein [Rufibacter psychrotolerans]|uniref:hypothetical protein n=1 Tax=Rufibacter psychrotolerans TaxID=2812556 RepID=UPI001966CF9A|nr:hypothetical protein [Rufibacter sp. SYSU D00308]
MLEHSLFHKLPPRNQAELLEQKGIALAHRNHKGWAITLFSFENRFMEVWAKMGVEVIGSFHAAATYMDIIEPYVPELQVPESA